MSGKKCKFLRRLAILQGGPSKTYRDENGNIRNGGWAALYKKMKRRYKGWNRDAILRDLGLIE